MKKNRRRRLIQINISDIFQLLKCSYKRQVLKQWLNIQITIILIRNGTKVFQNNIVYLCKL